MRLTTRPSPVAGRRDPSARSAHCAARTRVDRAGQTEPGVHDAAVDSRHRLAHRHRTGRRHQRRGRHFNDARHFASLVRLDSEGVLLRQHAPPGPHLQARRPLPAHAAHARRTFGAARRQLSRRVGRNVDRAATLGAAVQQRSNHNKAACALANKLASICYATLRDQRTV